MIKKTTAHEKHVLFNLHIKYYHFLKDSKAKMTDVAIYLHRKPPVLLKNIRFLHMLMYFDYSTVTFRWSHSGGVILRAHHCLSGQLPLKVEALGNILDLGCSRSSQWKNPRCPQTKEK